MLGYHLYKLLFGKGKVCIVHNLDFFRLHLTLKIGPLLEVHSDGALPLINYIVDMDDVIV